LLDRCEFCDLIYRNAPLLFALRVRWSHIEGWWLVRMFDIKLSSPGAVPFVPFSSFFVC
jgi:hypothetical protein